MCCLLDGFSRVGLVIDPGLLRRGLRRAFLYSATPDSSSSEPTYPNVSADTCDEVLPVADSRPGPLNATCLSDRALRVFGQMPISRVDTIRATQHDTGIAYAYPSRKEKYEPDHLHRRLGRYRDCHPELFRSALK